MTPEDQDRLISDMVKERNALRRERALLAEQVRRTQEGMRAAQGAANLASQGDYQAVERGFTYENAESFADTLKRGRAVEARLAELNERLDSCC